MVVSLRSSQKGQPMRGRENDEKAKADESEPRKVATEAHVAYMASWKKHAGDAKPMLMYHATARNPLEARDHREKSWPVTCILWRSRE